MIYYIDPTHGGTNADGMTAETARRTYTDLDIRPGDTVLFRRGSFIRDSLYRKAGEPGKPIVYGAYGEGDNPVFCGSADVSDPADWEEVRTNVWLYRKGLPTEACNFIFDLKNGRRMGGTLRWEEDQLAAQGDFHDTRFGCGGQYRGVEDSRTLLYSVGNPGEVYAHIECAVWGRRNLSDNVPWTVTEDLAFFGSGVHGMSGGSHDMVIRRCSFCYIGGAAWNRQLRIRFGNAVEFWEKGENILIEDCYFNEIYDSCITQQGSDKCEPAKNLIMRNNLFANYGMGAYEGRDRMLIGSAFTDNICLYAGGGFSAYGDTKPRNSEIYPQPMGHHLFIWRIYHATEGGGFEVARNIFNGATGRSVYAIIAPEAAAQMDIHDNIEGTDAALTAAKWFGKTGCSRLGAMLISEKLPENRYFIGSTDKDALSYAVGEEIRFDLALVEPDGSPVCCPEFRYCCRGDDGKVEEGFADGMTGTFTYRTASYCAGYVHLTVTPCDAEGNPLPGCDIFEGGACAGFDGIRETGAEPADFDAFWTRVIREELDPVEPVPVYMQEFHCGDPGDIVYDVRIACPGKNPVSGYLRMPRNAAEHSLPVTVTYMGYGVGTAGIPLKSTGITFAVNQHGLQNGQPVSYYKKLAETEYAGFGFSREENKNPDTVYFKHMVLRALQALRYCRTLPQWDGKNLTVCGGSMGAFQAVSAAAWDHGVTKLEAHIPWMCDLWGVKAGKLAGWRPECDPGIAYYDTASMGARVTCETAVFAGLGDYICPPSGVTALYHNIKGRKTLTMHQNRTHPYMAPRFEQYIREG